MDNFIFDHVGITTTQPQPQEDWVEASKIWVTNPRNHPEHIEFLRYRDDSTVPDAVRYNPHVAYRVNDLTPCLAAEGVEVLIAPFVVGDFLEVAFVRKHGVIFEYMRYLKEGWFGSEVAQDSSNLVVAIGHKQGMQFQCRARNLSATTK